MKVFAIAAQSADGFIAKSRDHFADWTSKEDKRLFVELTKKAGVVVMGATTFNTIGKPLPGRRNVVYTRESLGVDGIEETTKSPHELISQLEREGFSEVAITGGQQIYRMFLEAELISEIYFTYEPLLFGDGLSFIGKQANIQLKLLEYKKLNENALMAHYKVEYGSSNQ